MAEVTVVFVPGRLDKGSLLSIVDDVPAFRIHMNNKFTPLRPPGLSVLTSQWPGSSLRPVFNGA